MIPRDIRSQVRRRQGAARNLLWHKRMGCGSRGMRDLADTSSGRGSGVPKDLSGKSDESSNVVLSAIRDA